MAYGDKLEDLLAFTQMGAIEGPAALDALYSLQEERKAQRQARQAAALEAQQAQQESLMGLAGLAYDSSAAGDPLSALIQNPQYAATASAAGVGPKAFAKQTGYYGPGGVSTIGLPDQEAADIIEAVTTKQAEGLDIGTIKADVHSVARSQLGPLYPQVAQDIDALINKVYGG